MCSPGYGGVGCRDDVGGNAGVYWPVYDPVRLPDGGQGNTSTLQRMGHTLVSCDDKVRTVEVLTMNCDVLKAGSLRIGE